MFFHIFYFNCLCFRLLQGLTLNVLTRRTLVQVPGWSGSSKTWQGHRNISIITGNPQVSYLIQNLSKVAVPDIVDTCIVHISYVLLKQSVSPKHSCTVSSTFPLTSDAIRNPPPLISNKEACYKASWQWYALCVVVNGQLFSQHRMPTVWRCMAAIWDSAKWPVWITECTTVKCLVSIASLGRPELSSQFLVNIFMGIFPSLFFHSQIPFALVRVGEKKLF